VGFLRKTEPQAAEVNGSVAVETRPRPASYRTIRPMTAAAQRFKLNNREDRNKLADRPFGEWQHEAWEYFDAIGEIKYAFSLLGSVMSRLRLYPAVVIDPDAPPTSVMDLRRRQRGQTAEEHRIDQQEQMVAPDSITSEVMDKMAELIDDLSEGIGGLPGMIKTYTQCISVAGECYLIQYKGEWSIRSTDEVTVRASDGRAILRTLRSGGSSATGRLREIELPQRTFVGRIWRPHPRYSDEPDSSMIAVRELCDELLTVQRMIRTTARSRMNGGLMIVADSVTAASSSPAGDIEEAEEEADAFEQELMLALTTPVSDESSAMTIGPMVARAPAEIVREAINYQSFSRDADKSLVERADRVLDRIMQGIDIPKDIVTGLANIKYANAIKIDESLYKSHVEPLALMLCDAITSVYFRPALKAAFPDLAPEDLKKLVAWYDPTEVVTKPDPAAAADQGYQRFTLSADAWRRAHGFSDADAPSEEELARRLATEKVTIPPDLAAILLKQATPAVYEAATLKSLEEVKPPYPDSAREMLFNQQGAPGEEEEKLPPSPAETVTTAEESPEGVQPPSGRQQGEPIAASADRPRKEQ
jgi:hypothetical protein